MRQDLYDLGKITELTAYTKETREAARRYSELVLEYTKAPHNLLDFEIDNRTKKAQFANRKKQ